MSVFLKTKFVL